MKDEKKTKDQLLDTVTELRRQVSQLERSGKGRRQTRETVQKAEIDYSSIFDSVNDMIVVHDAKTGRPLDVNKKLVEAFGWSREEFLGLTVEDWSEGKPHFSQKEAMQNIKKAAAGNPQLFGWRCKDKKGRLFWVEVNLKLNDNGGKSCVLAVMRDITEHKRVEEELGQRMREFETFVNNIPHMAWLKDTDSNFILANKAFGNVVGMSQEYLKSHTCAVCFGEDAAKKFKQDDRRVIKGKKQITLEETIIGRDGNEICLETTKSPIFSDNGDAVGTAGIAIDITDRKRVEEELSKYRHQLEELVEERTEELKKELTERKRVEEALRESEGKFRSILKSMDDLVFVLDKNDRYISFYAPENKLYVKPDVFLGKKHSDVMPADIDKLFTNALKEIKQNKIAEYEYQLEVPEGLRWYNMKLSPIMEVDEYSGLVAVARDITERKKTEEALRESEQKLRNVFESVSEGIFAMDLHGAYTEVNKRILEMYGLNSIDEILGKSGFQFVAPQDIEKAKDGMKTVLEQGTVVYQEYVALRSDGSEFTVEVTGTLLNDDSGNPIGIIGIVRDITERKRTEKELINTQRLESLGFLAGGIAHDFNNLLGGIFGNIQLAIANSSSEQKLLRSLNNAMQSMNRARDLTQQLLTFSSGGAPVKKLISIMDALKESVPFALSGSTIHPVFSIDKDILPVEADQSQIHQVINNILLNARQAMPEGGEVEINAGNIKVKSKQIPQLQKGRYVKIAIKDHGIGMPKDILERIFDPFFTTKQSGSGLGLSICYSIVKKHDGHITVDSEPGVGSVFTIYLPASEKEIVNKPEKQYEILKGKGKILIMDDEMIISEMLANELDMLGYEAEVTYNGDEAIQAYEEAMKSGKKFDAAILDLTVPGGKGGKETITELMTIDPDIKAVVSSGYSDNPVMANPKEYGFCCAIQKPYKMEILSQVLFVLLMDNKDSTE